MDTEYVIVIDGVECPATIKTVGAHRVVLTPAQENFREISEVCTKRKAPVEKTVEYIGVILENTDIRDNIVWVKAGDYRVIEGQVILHNILGKVQVALRTTRTIEGKKGVYQGLKIIKLVLKHLRLPESSVVGLLRTTTNPLEA